MNYAAATIHKYLGNVKKSMEETLNVSLPEWKNMSQTQLADMYLDAEDDDMKGYCLSALIVKSWGILVNIRRKIYSAYASNEKCYDILVDSILKALHYAAWRNKSSSLSKAKDGAAGAISTCVSSEVANYFVHINRVSRCVNYSIISIDEQYDALGDSAECMRVSAVNTNRVKDAITSVMTSNIDMGILLDAICYQDVLKDSGDFSKRYLVKYFRDLTEDDVRYYANEYELDEKVVLSHITNIRNKKDVSLVKYINKLMLMAKNKREVLDLCF